MVIAKKRINSIDFLDKIDSKKTILELELQKMNIKNQEQMNLKKAYQQNLHQIMGLIVEEILKVIHMQIKVVKKYIDI